MATGVARRNRGNFICGPADNGCWLYGTRIADEHRFPDGGAAGPWEHGEGPLCVVCGLPRGTYEAETGGRAGAGQ